MNVFAFLLLVVAGVNAAPDPTKSSFERLKSLEGTWQIADDMEHPLRIRFYTTARESVLVKSWEVEGASHSLTIYHRNGDTIMATHYCPQGNQPRMILVPENDASIRFTFHDATDLNSENEQYQHDLSFDWSENGALVRSEIYRDAEGAEHPSQLVLIRATDEEGKS